MDGILYSATGDRYLAEALSSARSSLRFNSVPHVIFTDGEASLPAHEEERLSIEKCRASGNPFADKIGNMARSAFERSIFLDSDTYVAADLTHLFEVLEKFDMAACWAGYRGRRDREVPAAFYEFNTGVVAWRANALTKSFFADWLDTYEQLTRERPFTPIAHASGYEQPAFRRCAWRHDVRIYVLGPEYNYRTRQPGTVIDRVRVIHGRSVDYEQAEALLNRDVGPRSFNNSDFANGGRLTRHD